MTTNEPTASLVRAALAGDREILGALLEAHRPLVLGLCRRVLRDPRLAEDAVQEAALVAMLHLDRLRAPESFGAWLGGIALNVCHRWLRERSRDAWSWEALQGGGALHRALPSLEAGSEERAEAADLTRRVRHAVAELPRGQREAVVLFYLLGLSQREVAGLLRIPLGAVKARLHKARAGLREGLRAVWEEESMGLERREGFVEMRVADVRRSRAEADQPARHVVVLQEVNGERKLPIWMGSFEATSIAVSLEGVQAPRPMAYQFLAAILDAAGGRLREVGINRLVSTTFYAEVVVEGRGGVKSVDARPSDAINVALLTGVPIRADARVLEAGAKAPYGFGHEEYPDGPKEIAAVVGS